jgi:hypothetical protein
MKKFLKENGALILLLLIVLTVGIAIYGRRNKATKEEEIRKINEILDSDIGKAGTDVKTLIQGVKRATNFDSSPYAKAIYNAPGYINDDEQAVYDAVSKKSRAQIASIFDYFLSTYGKDLDIFLKGFMNAEEFQTVTNIIKLSK